MTPDTPNAGTPSSPILPDVRVLLVGEDGNAFAIIGRVRRAMKRAGHADRVDEFIKEATSSDYDHLLRTVMRWVDVCDDENPNED